MFFFVVEYILSKRDFLSARVLLEVRIELDPYNPAIAKFSNPNPIRNSLI